MSDKKSDETQAAGDTNLAEAASDGPVAAPEPKVEPRPVDPTANDTTDGKTGPSIHESYTLHDPTDDRPRLEDGPRSAPPLSDVPVDTGQTDS
jgi:hypothetical protein